MTFNVLKSLLLNRQISGAPVSTGLSFPRNPFPNANRLSQKREAYSTAEQKRILAALNQDLKAIHENSTDLSELQILVVHLLLLALATGRNMQSLLDMTRDSLRVHPLPDRELMVTFKRRGWSTQATSLRKTTAPEAQKAMQAIPATIGEHFRALCAITAPLVDEIDQRHRAYVFILRINHLKRKGQVVRLDGQLANAGLRMFVQRHALQDDRGEPLALNIARLRPTFATELYRRTRDIRRVQQALGHANVETTARHYVEVSPEAERDHAIVVDGMVSQFARMEVDGKILLAADGKMPLQDVKDILAGATTRGRSLQEPLPRKRVGVPEIFPLLQVPEHVRIRGRPVATVQLLLPAAHGAFQDQSGPLAEDLRTYHSSHRRRYCLAVSSEQGGSCSPQGTTDPASELERPAALSLSLLDLRPLKGAAPTEKALRPVSVAMQPDGSSLVVSRFGDLLWDWYPYLPNANLPSSRKRLDWRIQLPDGSALTDPRHAQLLDAAKDFLWSLFAQPIEDVSVPICDP